jgi:predicted ABC-type ATPase
MRRAQVSGSQAALHFVASDQVDTAILRVRDRVAKGGHNIAIADQGRQLPRVSQSLCRSKRVTNHDTRRIAVRNIQ